MEISKKLFGNGVFVSQPIIDGETICTKCGEKKPITEFYKASHLSRGYFPNCKECCRKKDIQRRAERKEYSNLFI
jgi:hypothetical protein